MAEESAQGKLHKVCDSEADNVVGYCENAIPTNEMLGRLVRNMYGRIQALESQIANRKAKKPKGEAGGP